MAHELSLERLRRYQGTRFQLFEAESRTSVSGWVVRFEDRYLTLKTASPSPSFLGKLVKVSLHGLDDCCVFMAAVLEVDGDQMRLAVPTTIRIEPRPTSGRYLVSNSELELEHENELIPASIADVGREGLGIHTYVPLVAGSTISIRVRFPSVEVEGKAKVVYSGEKASPDGTPEWRSGLRIVEMNRLNRSHWIAALKAHAIAPTLESTESDDWLRAA